MELESSFPHVNMALFHLPKASGGRARSWLPVYRHVAVSQEVDRAGTQSLSRKDSSFLEAAPVSLGKAAQADHIQWVCGGGVVWTTAQRPLRPFL